jgi:hypothetical protein
MVIFQRNKVLNAMTRSSSRRAGANRLTTGGPRSHGNMVNSTAFPELGHVAAGSTEDREEQDMQMSNVSLQRICQACDPAREKEKRLYLWRALVLFLRQGFPCRLFELGIRAR